MFETGKDGMQNVVDHLVTLGSTWGLRIIGVLVALLIAWVIAGWVKRSLQSALEARKFDATLTRFFANMARYAIIVGAGLGCLGVFGIETTSFAAVIAAGGLAVGLAFQGTLSNFAAGVMLLIFRPFKVGDVVSIAGQLGTVQEIDLFTAELSTLDNRKIILPNSKIFGDIIENITDHDTRRVDVKVGVTYSADIDKTREVLNGALKDIPNTLEDPPPQIFLEKLGDSSVDWQVRVWCKTSDYWDVHQAGIRAVKMALDSSGLSIPFPQQDVHFDDSFVQAIARK